MDMVRGVTFGRNTTFEGKLDLRSWVKVKHRNIFRTALFDI